MARRSRCRSRRGLLGATNRAVANRRRWQALRSWLRGVMPRIEMGGEA